MSSPDVAGILAALARLPGTRHEHRARLRVARSAVLAACSMRESRYRGQHMHRTDARLVADVRRRNARTQPRDAGGRFACRT